MSRVDRILEILDVGLQDTTPTHYGYGDVVPRVVASTADDFIASYEGLIAARGITVEEAMQWAEGRGNAIRGTFRVTRAD